MADNQVQHNSLGQFVKQLAARLQKNDVDLPLKGQKVWHELFYDLKKLPSESGKPQFLDELIFDWDSAYPQSRELSEFLNGLHISASGHAHNPRFDKITVDSESAERWIKLSDSANEDFKQFIDDAVDLATRKFAA